MATPLLPEQVQTQDAVLLYDGLCGFCDGTVRWLLRRSHAKDHAGRIYFLAQQTELAQAIFARYGISKRTEEDRAYLLVHPGTEQEQMLRSLRADALQCVAPVGDSVGQLPQQALAAAVRLLEPDSLVAYMHDPGPNPEDAVTFGFWRRELGSQVDARELIRLRYVHRQTVNGRPFEMNGVVWRIVRP